MQQHAEVHVPKRREQGLSQARLLVDLSKMKRSDVHDNVYTSSVTISRKKSTTVCRQGMRYATQLSRRSRILR
eukprot:2266006-Amphidinium_carterae.1